MIGFLVMVSFGFLSPPQEKIGNRKPPQGGWQEQQPDTAAQRRIAGEVDKYLGEIRDQIKGKEEKPVSEVFKNIKALDPKMPAGRLPDIMGMWSRNLGVSCKVCHVAGDWDKDDQIPKESARGMMAMVAHINEKELPAIKGMDEGSRVGCWTCHRGQRHPQGRPPGAGGPPRK